MIIQTDDGNDGHDDDNENHHNINNDYNNGNENYDTDDVDDQDDNNNDNNDDSQTVIFQIVLFRESCIQEKPDFLLFIIINLHGPSMSFFLVT